MRICVPDFPDGTMAKSPPANAGDMGLIPKDHTYLGATKSVCHNY